MQVKNDNKKYVLACAAMILLAFIQCYRTIHDLHWAYEPDFDRDIAYIRSTLNGHYGQDPNYAGQYMWYNPMLFLFETLAVKLTGLPINVVVARAGAFLNLINPVLFFIMVLKLFDSRIALAALLSFLFLASGDLPCWGGATYSPWLISDTFVQFLFYINVIFCYKAFTTQKMLWFAVLGASIGVTFLGHSAPAILIILILIFLQVQQVFKAIKNKTYPAITTYLLQGLFTFIPFIIFAFPFLYYVWGKYHFHFLNHAILECAPGIFERRNSVDLVKANITFSLLIAIIGLIWFYRNYANSLVRKIITSWLLITVVMYLYESVVPTVNRIYNVNLPDTIPAFHYFFYLKAAQSILFGLGFVFIINKLTTWLQTRNNKKFSPALSNNIMIGAVLLYTIVYSPIYFNRVDFSLLRQQALDKSKETERIEVYNFIVDNVPLNTVLLCNHDMSLFPVMPTGIKMVSVETYFSNPYVSYEKRESDRNDMLSYLTTAKPLSAVKLFHEYNVGMVVLPNSEYQKYKLQPFATNDVLFTNAKFTLFKINLAQH
ncbi:hypothetical protein [Mucilaginibacter sp.]|uniref:hypothetical protein n=1 Tax=Mucilaginibacter sp. TaxID=1882438 RepID=UPI003D0F4845